MSKIFIDETTLTNIANAIRTKLSTSEPIPVLQMDGKILSIPSGGGGGYDIPDDAFHLTGNCSYRFAYDGWSWFLRDHYSRITSGDIYYANEMFSQSHSLEEINITLNFAENYPEHGIANMFMGCSNLKVLPKMNNLSPKQAGGVFQDCNRLREIPHVDIDFTAMDNEENAWSCQWSNMFCGCHSLRKIAPIWLHTPRKCQYYSNILYYSFFQCTSLDELVDMPLSEAAQLDSPYDTNNECIWDGNAFDNAFYGCGRLKRLTFKQYDKGYKMANQFIDLSEQVGYTYSEYLITDFNSGISFADKVVNADDYARLKGTEDWYTTEIAFSRYNLTSAIETLNTLPDTAEFVNSYGASNIIQFRGDAGSSTDGGAIRDLPVELINEAAIKGWTVSLV